MRKDYLFLAFGNIRHKGVRSWLTILGIFIGIAAVVSLISLGQGLESAITAQFNTLSTDTLLIQSAGTGFGPPGSTAVRKLTSDDLQIVSTVQGVDLAIPRLIRITRVEFNDIENFYYVADIPDGREESDFIYKSFSIRPASGRLLKSGENGRVVIGADIADETKNGFRESIVAGSEINIQGKDFEVIAVLRPASSFQVNSAILMSNEDLKDILDIGDEIDMIAARVEDPDNMEQVAEQISEKLRRDRNQDRGEEDFSVQTPLQALGAVRTILTVINIVVSGIAAVSLLIGAVGITNSMYTSVLERTKEIGVMKAIGAKNKDILWIFLIESSLLGLVGGLIGTIIGLGLAFAVSSIANASFGTNLLAVSVSFPLVIGALIFSVFLGVLSGILPALQASNLKPVEALRK